MKMVAFREKIAHLQTITHSSSRRKQNMQAPHELYTTQGNIN